MTVETGKEIVRHTFCIKVATIIHYVTYGQEFFTKGFTQSLTRIKQECIPVGCVPPASVAATRCQYWGVGIPIPWDHSPPLDHSPQQPGTIPPGTISPMEGTWDQAGNDIIHPLPPWAVTIKAFLWKAYIIKGRQCRWINPTPPVNIIFKDFRLVIARKEVGARLYFHRRLWFCSRGGSAPGGGGACSRGWCGDPPEMATAAGGTHPTGMHSCSECFNAQELGEQAWSLIACEVRTFRASSGLRQNV